MCACVLREPCVVRVATTPKGSLFGDLSYRYSRFVLQKNRTLVPIYTSALSNEPLDNLFLVSRIHLDKHIFPGRDCPCLVSTRNRNALSPYSLPKNSTTFFSEGLAPPSSVYPTTHRNFLIFGVPALRHSVITHHHLSSPHHINCPINVSPRSG